MNRKIGELARATRTKVETVRYYETIDLLDVTPRSAANYRVYDRAQLDRLSFVPRPRARFSIEEVRQLLDMADVGARSCAEVDRLARAHLDAIERKIADLKALRHELDAMLTTCPSRDQRLPDHRSFWGFDGTLITLRLCVELDVSMSGWGRLRS